MFSKPRRDDVDIKVIQEIEKMFPGMEIKFAGQEGTEISHEAKEAMEALESKLMQDLVEGRCTDCSQVFMPENWLENEEWPEGTGYFTDHNGDLIAIQCPACNAKEKLEDEIATS